MIQWSYSALKKYVTCPRQYNEIKVLKNFTEPDTHHTIYGKEIHSAFEEYIKHGTPLLKNYQRYEKLLLTLLQIPGEHYTEHKMALTVDKIPCEFGSENYWVRGIGDLIIDDGELGFVFDYKTGNPRYADPKQLKLMALMMFEHFPELARVKAGLLFTSHNGFVPEEYHREDIEELWDHFTPDLFRLEHSFTTGHWPPNPNGLCSRYCAVRSCQYNGINE